MTAMDSATRPTYQAEKITSSIITAKSIIEPDAETVAECRRLAAAWAPTLQALANPDRLLIALWLADNSCSVRDLERVTGLSQSLVSYHLRTLRQSGLVTATSAGRANIYRLSHPDLDKLAALMGTLQGPDSAPGGN
jgi:DNA-binding transcriptional ArsR family regulator